MSPKKSNAPKPEPKKGAKEQKFIPPWLTPKEDARSSPKKNMKKKK